MEEEKREYLTCMEYLSKDLDAVLDLFKYKFIAFPCNVNKSHWRSYIAVNAKFLLHPECACVNDKFAGFFVLDSAGGDGLDYGLKTGNNDRLDCKMVSYIS